jgi:sugar porter (SP) family MFS transporter
MKTNVVYVFFMALIVALGGFLLGFDSAVISGAIKNYSLTFGIDQASFWFGFSVSSLTFGSIAGNLAGGVLADKYGRKTVLIATAILFSFCALGSAFSYSLPFFIFSRIVGGIGVGMAILVAPMYIAEIAPQKHRGTMVSINQLNIVLGISVAFFSNYYINGHVSNADANWRWMLGIGVIPAVLYLVLLFFVPSSPRWLAQKGRMEDARKVLHRVAGDEYAAVTLKEIEENIQKDQKREKSYFSQLFTREMRWIMLIGLGIAFFQQITAINAILYYAPIIFETAGGGRDAALMQAIIIGLVNLVFTVVAMFFIDKLGRKPLLIIGLSGIVVAYILCSSAFFQAEYKIDQPAIEKIALQLPKDKFNEQQILEIKTELTPLIGKQFTGELDFYKNVEQSTGTYFKDVKDTVLKNSITMNAMLVLIGILIFIGAFAISLGPVTWALLSEIFPNRIRGLAISVAGTFNALVSTLVVTVFPMELAKFGSALTFALFAVLACIGLLFVLKYVPETKGKSLEELEKMLVK